jgi:histidyl-tRNA synthetase
VAPPNQLAMGSIGSGGRYDDLTGILDSKAVLESPWSRPNLFSLEGIYFRNKFSNYKSIILNFGVWLLYRQFKIEGRVEVELSDNAKVAKQFQHADKGNSILQ